MHHSAACWIGERGELKEFTGQPDRLFSNVLLHNRASCKLREITAVRLLPLDGPIAQNHARHIAEPRREIRLEMCILLVDGRVLAGVLQRLSGETPEILIFLDLGVVDESLTADPLKQGLSLLWSWIAAKSMADLHNNDMIPQLSLRRNMDNVNKSSSHAVFNLKLHVVLVTKYRRKTLTPELLEYLEAAFAEILDAWRCKLLEFGGEADHVHLLIDIHPALDISVLINNLKTASARRSRNRFAEHLSAFYSKPLFWHRAYFVGSVGGATLETVRAYVDAQGTVEHARNAKSKPSARPPLGAEPVR